MAHRGWEAELKALRSEAHASGRDRELRAAAILQGALADLAPANAEDCLRQIMAAGRRVIAAQPASAAIFRLVNDMLWAASHGTDADAMRTQALASLAERYEAGRAAEQALADQAGAWLARYPAVMAYARSEALVAALLGAQARRKDLAVVCGESRPGLEGQLLAQELGSAGVPVTLGIDMALFGWLPTVAALILWSEGVSALGLAVKVGARALLEAAADRGIPRIALATTIDFLPAEYVSTPDQPAADPDEIMPPTKNVSVRNQTLEAAPLELVSFLLTEGGRMDPPAVRDALAALQVFPGLVGVPAR